MAGYIHFTDEQKQRANSVDLADFLRRQGEQLERSGREWRWKRHDSVTILGNQWFRHSSRQGGLAIDFVQEFYNLPFPDAVTLLLGGEQGATVIQSNKNTSVPERKEFVLPEAADNMSRVYAYLLKQRYIDRDVLTHFVREKKIYEDKEYHNAIFVGFDEKGNACHAHKRGTYSKAAGYRGNVEGSDPKYSFNYIGTSNVLHVFEAPIDMLSFLSIYKNSWQQHNYVTLDGVSEHAMLHVLSRNRQLNHVTLCLDHDPAGIEAADRLTEILLVNGYDKVSCLQSAYKDWNEDLKAQHGVMPIPAQAHPKIEACHKLSMVLYDLCSEMNSIKNPHGMLLEQYEKYCSLTQTGKAIHGKEAIVTEQLQSMAAYALLSVKEQYRQLEHPVDIEQLTDQLYANYHPHKDRDRLKVKADNMQQDVASINIQLQQVGIRTINDRQNLISSYMSLALNCAKAHIFIEIEAQEQKLEIQQKQNTNRTAYKQICCEEAAQPSLNF